MFFFLALTAMEIASIVQHFQKTNGVLLLQGFSIKREPAASRSNVSTGHDLIEKTMLVGVVLRSKFVAGKKRSNASNQ